jgi:diacylglycerol kinase (ATP)
MKTRFIFNPQSGHNRRRPGRSAMIRDFIHTNVLDASLNLTEGPGHATELARQAVMEGCELVVAVGGDGTMNEVAQALLETPAALALVPCGSGNGLALHLGLPRSFVGALELITGDAARVATLDTGVVNGRPFFNAMGLGLDADVSRRFNALVKRGLPAYARTAIAALRALQPERVTIAGAGFSETLDVLLVTVANSDQYGNNARIAPGARVDDGLLDLVAVRPVDLLGAAALATRLFYGNIQRSPAIRRWRGRRFAVTRSAPGVIHTDGETHAVGATAEVAVRSASLRVLIPAASHAVTIAHDTAPAGFALQLP